MNGIIDITSVVIGIITGVVVGIVVGIAIEEYRWRRERKFSRKKDWEDALKGAAGKIRNLSTIWDTYKLRTIPYTGLRKTLVEYFQSLREYINDREEFFSEKVKRELSEIHKRFLELAGEKPGATDEQWSKNVEEEMDKIQEGLKEIRGKLIKETKKLIKIRKNK